MQRVDPRFWMVPWKELEAGRIGNGAQPCGLETLRPLCP
jgi:hypothetical protein